MTTNKPIEKNTESNLLVEDIPKEASPSKDTSAQKEASIQKETSLSQKQSSQDDIKQDKKDSTSKVKEDITPPKVQAQEKDTNKQEEKPQEASTQKKEDSSQDASQEQKELQATDQRSNKKQKQETLPREEITVQKEPELPHLRLNGLYATKLGMSSIYNEQGQVVPVTVLRFDIWKVTQIKTKERDGYTAIQIGSMPKSQRKSNKAQIGHLKKSGFSSSVTFLREIRGDLPKQPDHVDVAKDSHGQLGQTISIESLAKGDRVHLSSTSKGRGFTGTMKRWGYGGGPSSHGSQFHRQPGSIGMCEEPARVVPGKGMPGRHGGKRVTLKHVEVVDILPDKALILIKGGVPGAINTLVQLMKEGVSQ